MNNVAIDTNILLYALDNFYPEKQSISIQIIADKPLFCSQSLSEFTNVCLRKWKFSKENVAEIINEYLNQCTYIPITEEMIFFSFEVMNKYRFQLFDSMIISAAIKSGCSILYSEDMNNGQIIEKQLQIVNPFKV
jgi:predicted nucleic acid-binding protein